MALILPGDIIPADFYLILMKISVMMMKPITNKQRPWIKKGYTIFSKEGPNGLKVETLARLVNKSKSSFYHHFADLEIYVDYLLYYHKEVVAVIAKKEQECTNMEELIEVMLEHKEDLLFNRQLRIYRDHDHFARCLAWTDEQVIPAVVPIWSRAIGLPDQSYLAAMVLNLSMENFYLQLTEKTFYRQWLTQYFKQLRATINALKSTNGIVLDMKS